MTIAALTTAFERSARVWSRDDASDNLELMKKGEAMLFAAIDLICALESEVERVREAGSEKAKAERLFAIARQMTALGLPGEDPDDPRVAALLEEAADASKTVDEMAAWIAKRRRN